MFFNFFFSPQDVMDGGFWGRRVVLYVAYVVHGMAVREREKQGGGSGREGHRGGFLFGCEAAFRCVTPIWEL